MPQPQPNPDRIFEFITSSQRSAAIRAAIDLDLFTIIGEGASDPPAIAERCQCPQRGVRILCDAMTAYGFLEKSGGGYLLAPESSAFLDRRSPAYLGSIVNFLQNPDQQRNFQELTGTIRRGTVPPDREDAFGVQHPMWIEFARSMGAMMRPVAEFIGGLAANGVPTGRLKTLDVAAGHGLFGIAVAQQHRAAEVTALDWPGVLAVAEENARAAGVSGRHHLLPGSAFDTDPGDDYDLVLVTNFFHHFDQATCVSLMKRFRKALRADGIALTLDFIPDENRVSPPMAATFALFMLANTPAGDVYTYSQYAAMFQEAGFGASELVEPPAGPMRVIRTRAS